MSQCRFDCGKFGTQPLSRREMLARSAGGFGSIALAALLAEGSSAGPASSSAAGPLAPRAPHFTPRAQRVVFVFMHGGPSQVDTFDYKPLLARDHGRPYPGQK